MPALEPVSRRGPGTGAAPDADTRRGEVPGTTSTATLRSAARGGTLNLVSAACNQAALFLATASIARFLGKVALGEYALGLAVLSLVGGFALFGFQMTLTRYVAVHLADADDARLRGTIVFGVGFSFCLATLLCGCVMALAGPLATLFNRPDFAGDLRLVAMAVPAGVLRDSCLAAVQGWRTQRAFGLITWVYEPTVRLALTTAALAFGYGLRGAFIAILVGSWSAAALALRALTKRVRRTGRRGSITEVRALLRFSSVSLGTGMASVGLVWADLIILGILSDTGSAGVYTVSTRLVNLAVFVMLPINAAFAPQFAHLLHLREHAALEHVYRAATGWILRLSLPAFVVLIVFPDSLLRLFGTQYTIGAAVTVILSIGQLVNASTGPCGTLLNMGGRVGVNMANNIIVLILNVCLNVALIPRWGMVGAAIAWSLSLTLVNIARVIEVTMLLHATPFGLSTVKSLTAGAVAAATCIGIRVALPSSAEQLSFGIVAAIAVYCGAQALLGIDREDREFISSLMPHRKTAVN